MSTPISTIMEAVLCPLTPGIVCKSSLTLQTPGSSRTRSRLSLAEAVEKTGKVMIIEALKETKGNQSQAAQYLDTSLRI